MRSIDDLVHELGNGRWIVAHWNAMHHQWQSDNLRDPERGYAYSYAGTLEGLARLGIITYATKSGAVRAARRFLPSR